MPRPEIPIDWNRVDELLMAGCLGTEVAAFYGMHEDTFYRRVNERYKVGFTEYMAKKRAGGDALIREAQYKKAVKKQDNTMLIWLGKQRLGQKEGHEAQVSDDVKKAFDGVMSQLNQMQSDKKSEETAT